MSRRIQVLAVVLAAVVGAVPAFAWLGYAHAVQVAQTARTHEALHTVHETLHNYVTTPVVNALKSL